MKHEAKGKLAETTAEEAMKPGPTTVRPDTPAEKMAEHMQKRGTTSVLVTIPDGEVVGLMYREDAERPDNTGSPEDA